MPVFLNCINKLIFIKFQNYFTDKTQQRIYNKLDD